MKRVLRGRDELGIIYQYIIDRANYVSVKETSGQKEKFDWEYLVRILRYHGVFPLFYRAFSTTPEGNVDDVRDHLRSHYYSIVMRNQLLCSELVRILGLFKAESIEVISFKGPTLAALAYGSISQRQFADIDLLVHFEDLEAVRQIMEAEAYWPYFRAYRRPIVRLTKAQKRSYLRNYHEYEFRREDGMQVDLHWHTAPRQFPFRLDPERLWSDLQIVSLEEGDVSTFSSENLLLYLCVHGAKEQWRRLAWVIDLDRLLRAHGDMNWDIILREARNAHATRAL
ncbi:MAG: nucleotidyltransferase family protein, partial [Gammaproteobacteria bacterium]|nr:nucleotidyltransferase family protein [Gammaproteobacteria bacterium]